MMLDAAITLRSALAMYFMFGDEVDYFMRLKHKSRIVSHLGAMHYHPDVTKRPLTPEKFYYYVKNTIILNQLYFDQRAARHVMAIVAALIPLIILLPLQRFYVQGVTAAATKD